MKIIFATGNEGKLREAAEILGEAYELETPADYGITEDIPETGDTLEENSLQKARYIYERTGVDCFADDTGLEVDELGGAPGVYTARYATLKAAEYGEPAPVGRHNFDANMDMLLRELDKAGAKTRRARFRSVVTLIQGGKVHYFEGIMPGRIATGKAGCGGFGYDPVFIADDYPDRTVAELSEEQKNLISHRGKALRKMAAFVRGEKD
ncbi:MAG: RdgB/HAM1 family non-canonical purine NTP pyrophosphatase [Bacteroidales bacterium]|nr:RdgB/HAM1 family non-canonical purine NTP pyrophosphatase [Bacteroidales bacterium]